MNPLSSTKSPLTGWWATAGACAIAVVRCLSASPPPKQAVADDATKRAMFSEIASDETKMRHDAAKKFPTDLWSQDDDFHHSELKRAQAVAEEHGVRLSDALSAIDEGIRGGWPHDASVVIRTTVVPCQPRAIY